MIADLLLGLVLLGLILGMWMLASIAHARWPDAVPAAAGWIDRTVVSRWGQRVFGGFLAACFVLAVLLRLGEVL